MKLRFKQLRLPLAAALLLAGLLPGTANAADTFKVDPLHTQTIFNINHLGYSSVMGNFHDIEGTVRIDDKDLARSEVDVRIMTTSVDTGVPARDERLRGEEFFNVKKFPLMTFKSSKVTPTGDHTADVAGDLTIIGVSQPVVLKVVINRQANDVMRGGAVIAGFAATAAIKRSDFGMKAFLPYLGDDVQLTINFEGIKQ